MEQNADMGKNRLIGTLDKSTTEDVRVTLRLYKENLYVDIRTWASTFEGPTPTKKGVQIPINQLNKLILLLTQVQGLLDKKYESAKVPAGANAEETITKVVSAFTKQQEEQKNVATTLKGMDILKNAVEQDLAQATAK